MVPGMLRGALACLLALLLAAPAAADRSGYAAHVAPLSAAQRRAMTGVSWHPGCPVPLSGLRAVTVRHWDWRGAARDGVLIVNARVAAAVTRIFARLYAVRYPIRLMQPVDAYGGSDFRSIEADNCRPRSSGSR